MNKQINKAVEKFVVSMIFFKQILLFSKHIITVTVNTFIMLLFFWNFYSKNPEGEKEKF